MAFDTDHFIISIEQKKSIWNTSCSDYKNRDVKIKDWEDIGETMNLDFKDFTRKEKDDFSEYIILIVLITKMCVNNTYFVYLYK